jgi:hypothetical protein
VVQNFGNAGRGMCARDEAANGGGEELNGNAAGLSAQAPERWKPSRQPAARPAGAVEAADRWAEEQMFEEDVRAVLSMMRPNRRERLLGWTEFRTGGSHFRITASWDEQFELADGGGGKLRIPNMADVLEAILVGSAVHDDDMPAAEEFELYRAVLREVYRRLDDLQECYE